jgi:hypothetical protein
MAVAEVHPSFEVLAAFTLGILGEEAQASIEAHVAACTSCKERAAIAPADAVAELLRSVHARTSRGGDTFAEAAAQVQTPGPLAAVAVTDALAPAVAPSAPAASHRPEVPDGLPPELARHERYRVVRLLGAGGMGAVYQAEHRVMQRLVALKVIKRAYTANAAALDRFRGEVRAAARLSHPNVVNTYDAEDVGETHFLVMEYVEGTDLGRLVQERGPLPVDRACEYVRQAALGLQYAFEQGMVHRDLKPHNLMLTPDGRVKILDFGLACFASQAASAAGVTGTGLVLGTVDYIAPEQADNAHEADIRCDIYSLGCTLYHLLAGHPPFPTGTPLQKVMAHAKKKPQPLTKLRPDLPEGVMPVLERMMAKNPGHRYQTPAEVAIALESLAVETAITREPRPQPRTRATNADWTVLLKKPPVDVRRRRLVAVATATMFVVAGLLGAAVYRVATDKGEPSARGFVPLFNGKDLSGWKTHPKQPGEWRVRDGVLTCRGPLSHLFSDRADFENFHLKARVRMLGGGNSGLFFRTEFGLSSGPRPVGYEAEISGDITGSLLAHTPEGQLTERMVHNTLKDQKDWFTMEVIAEGADIVTRINERTIVDCRLPAGYRKRGHLALQHASPETVVEFSKIEVKELPRSDRRGR